MAYIAKERIWLNDAGQPCEPDDERVAQMLVAPGNQLKDSIVKRYGLEKDRRLMALPGAEGAPVRERGSDYYELTGEEKPVTKHQQAALGQPQAPQPIQRPATAARDAEDAKPAPAKAKG